MSAPAVVVGVGVGVRCFRQSQKHILFSWQPSEGLAGGKVTSGWLTGGKVKSGWLTGGKVKSGWLTGGKVKSGWLTGGKVTGAWLLTGGKVTGAWLLTGGKVPSGWLNTLVMASCTSLCTESAASRSQKLPLPAYAHIMHGSTRCRHSTWDNLKKTFSLWLCDCRVPTRSLDGCAPS